MELKAVFSGTKPSGVYRVDVSFPWSKLETLANEHDFALFLIDGDKIASKADFLDQFIEKLQPPDYGKSWDDFEEMLQVPYWIESKGLIILYKDFQQFFVENTKDFDMALDILQHVTEFHNRRASYPQVMPLFVLLQGYTTANLSFDWLR